MIVAGRIVAVDTPAGLGGRATAAATVHWVDEAGPHQVATAAPTRLITELSRGRELRELTVTRPSLEDVYLELIGENR